MSDNTDATIGMNVRRARRYAGLTLEQLAGRIGKSKGWLSMIENGRLRMEKARASAMLGDDGEAITELRAADQLSPAQVRNNPLIREMVAHMLDSARREAGGRELRGLAWRMGLVGSA